MYIKFCANYHTPSCHERLDDHTSNTVWFVLELYITLDPLSIDVKYDHSMSCHNDSCSCIYLFTSIYLIVLLNVSINAASHTYYMASNAIFAFVLFISCSTSTCGTSIRHHTNWITATPAGLPSAGRRSACPKCISRSAFPAANISAAWSDLSRKLKAVSALQRLLIGHLFKPAFNC